MIRLVPSTDMYLLIQSALNIASTAITFETNAAFSEVGKGTETVLESTDHELISSL